MYLVEQSHCDKISEDASQGDQGLNTDLTMVGQKCKATSPCVSLHCGHGATSSEEYFAERFVSLSSATCFASWHIRLVVPGSMIFAIQQPRRGVWLTAGTLLSHHKDSLPRTWNTAGPPRTWCAQWSSKPRFKLGFATRVASFWTSWEENPPIPPQRSMTARSDGSKSKPWTTS